MTSPQHTFSFDPDEHVYGIDNRVVPSVTEVITECVGSGFDFMKGKEWYLQRGRAVHACAKLVAEGKTFTCDPQIEGRVEALRKWFREHQPHDFVCEVPVYSVEYQYAGTPDLPCLIQNRPYIVDWKGTLDEARVALQIGGYAIAMKAPTMTKGLGVELHDDGTYRMTHPIDLKRARNEFLALLTTYRIRCRLGVLNKESITNATE